MSSLENDSSNPTPVLLECPTYEQYGQTAERLISEGYRFHANVDKSEADARSNFLLSDEEIAEVVMTSAWAQPTHYRGRMIVDPLPEMIGVWYR